MQHIPDSALEVPLKSALRLYLFLLSRTLRLGFHGLLLVRFLLRFLLGEMLLGAPCKSFKKNKTPFFAMNEYNWKHALIPRPLLDFQLSGCGPACPEKRT